MTTRCFSPPLSVSKARHESAVPVDSSACRRDRARTAGTFEREGAEVRIASHQHDVEDGEVERRVRFLRNEGDAPPSASGRRAERTAVQVDRAHGSA